jgi:tetratricopeptide (TPR) repeat protein
VSVVLNPDVLADLEEQRAFLVRSLDDLDREVAAGDLDEADARALRDDYTHRLAEVQRTIEEGRFTAAPGTPPRRAGRTLGIVAVVAALAVGAGLAVAAASGSRRPGDTITGGINESASSRLSRAAGLAQQGEFVEALRLYDEVLREDPENVEAHAERGLLLVSLSGASERPVLAADGRRSIERALELDPENARSLFYLGLALRLEGDADGARDAFDRALAANPPDALRGSIEQFRGRLDG